MKNLLSTLKILAAVLIITIFNDSANSQNVISSINASSNAKLISQNLNTDIETITLHRNAENWMSNKYYLELSYSSSNYSNLSLFEFMITKEKIFEQDIEIENWMLDYSKWQIESDVNNDLQITEKIEFEEWMFDEYFWIIENKKEEIPIEDWMLDNNFWVMVN